MESATNYNLRQRLAPASLRTVIFILAVLAALPGLYAQTGSLVGTLMDHPSCIRPTV